MSNLDKIRSWLSLNSKLWFLRASISLALLAIILTELQLLKLDTSTILLLLVSLLLLVTEIFLEEISSLRSTIRDGIQIESHEVDEQIKRDANKAKNITVIARSGESKFFVLHDIIVERRNRLSLHVIFTQSVESDERFTTYQSAWIEKWLSLCQQSATKYSYHVVKTKFELEGVLIDERIAYLKLRDPFIRSLETNKLHRKESWTRCTRESTQGAFLFSLYQSWIIKETQNSLTSEKAPR